RHLPDLLCELEVVPVVPALLLLAPDVPPMLLEVPDGLDEDDMSLDFVAGLLLVSLVDAMFLRMPFASAMDFSWSAFACFLQALFSLPFWSSHFSLATSYVASALALATLYSPSVEPLRLDSSSALATFSWPFASFSHTSLALPLMDLHF